ncbi:MAG TPA: pantoate--beta-alanine ligase [Polyangia bacterium]
MSRPVPRLVTDPAQMSAEGDAARVRGDRIVLVPTMGALHAGHVSLLDEGRRQGDRLVLSIFVNPTQFGPKEDLAKYPRPVEADLEKAALAGVDVVFMPTAAAMYPSGYQTFVEVRELQQGLCGEVRPGHFVGVATVVCKLFTIVRPHIAVFGEKDFQQLAVITRMTADLNLGVQIVPSPTVREPDGLAMSSRNVYLSPAERTRAVALSQGLRAAAAALTTGERDGRKLLATAKAIIKPAVDRLEYLELRDAATLAPISSVTNEAVLLVAAFVGTTRLIDNLRLTPT